MHLLITDPWPCLPSLVSTAQAMFLIECGHTNTHTEQRRDATAHPIHTLVTASVGKQNAQHHAQYMQSDPHHKNTHTHGTRLSSGYDTFFWEFSFWFENFSFLVHSALRGFAIMRYINILLTVILTANQCLSASRLSFSTGCANKKQSLRKNSLSQLL